jgi:hypothetical protein
MLSVKLYGSEILNIFGVKEHVANDRFLLVALEWVSSEQDALENDSHGVRRHHYSSSNNRLDSRVFNGLRGEAHHLARVEDDRTNC